MSHLNSNRRKPAASAAAVLVLLLACLGLAACGSSSGSSSSTDRASAATTTPTARRGRHRTERRPLRGDARMPAEKRHHAAETDPRPGTAPGGAGGFLGGGARRGGGPQLPKGVTRAQYEAAVKKCGGGNFAVAVAAARASTAPPSRQALAKFATCMRENGVNVPAPNTSGNGPIFNTKGINTSSAQFKAAEAKCQSDLRAPSGVDPAAVRSGPAAAAPGGASGAERRSHPGRRCRAPARGGLLLPGCGCSARPGGRRIAAEVGLAATFGAGNAPMCVSSSFHCVRLSVPLATNGAGAVAGPEVRRARGLGGRRRVSAARRGGGWKSIWTASRALRVASVFAAPGYFIRLTIWLGRTRPAA